MFCIYESYRQKSLKQSGGQHGHKGTTLTKEKLEKKIEENNLKVKKIVHYIHGDEEQEDTIKYKIGLSVNLYVEKHIFIVKNQNIYYLKNIIQM